MKIGRRALLTAPAAMFAARAQAADITCNLPKASKTAIRLKRPGEWKLHKATWMANGATVRAWGDETATALDRDLSNSRTVARQDLMRLAANLSRFEPVVMLVSDAADEIEARRRLKDVIDGVSPKDQLADALDGSGRIYIGKAKSLGSLPAIGTHAISFLVGPLDDLWTRDTAPVFSVASDGDLYGGLLNFNGWGQWPITTCLSNWTKDKQKTANGVLDQFIENDRKTGRFIAEQVGSGIAETWLTMEGGGLEVNGAGLGLAMASSIVNDNRNPGMSYAEIERELNQLFGVERMIWMPGVYGEELTDWHVDFTARFASQGKIVYAFDRNWEPKDNRNEKALLAAVEAVNQMPKAVKARYLGEADALTLHPLPTPRINEVYEAYARRNTELKITERSLEEFTLTTAPGYVGYTHANGAIIMGQFGDTEHDLVAFDAVQALYPDHAVIQITTDGLASGGGTIHCATQEVPA